MVSDKVFNTDGIQKIFSSDFDIISEDHLRVYLGAAVVSRDDYDLINNAAVFNVAPTTGQVMTVQVGTTPADILTSPTDAGIVAANIADVNTVAGISGDVSTVAGITANIAAVVSDASDIGIVAADIANVNAVAGNETNINAAVANETNINAVVADASDIGIVATNIANVNTVAGDTIAINAVNANATNINAVVADASDIGIVATNIADVTAVADNETNIDAAVANATNINAAVANEADIDTVAANIANVNTVAGNTTNINAVNANEADIDTVATNIASVNTVAGNTTNINAVNANETNINAVNANSTNINAAVANETNINAAVANETNINAVVADEVNIGIVAGIGSAGLAGIVANETNINVVGTNIADVSTVAGIDANVTTVAGISADVTAAATNAADITAVATEVAKVVEVANDLQEAISEIDTVATSIANVDLVGGSITNVNEVATNIGSVNAFGEQYRVSATEPTTSLDAGDLWFDTTTNTMKVYTGAGFANAGSSVNGIENSVEYIATAGQTSFAVVYDAGYLNVFLNGVKLDSTDYTATDGANVVLDTGATVGDSVFIQSFGTFELADHYSKVASDARYAQTVNHYTKTEGDARYLQLTGGTVTGPITATDFIGPLNGAVQFEAKNTSGGTITKGQAIAISGISGNTPTVTLADADAATMPAFGLAATTATDNNTLQIVTFGSLKGIKTDYSGWAVGQPIYVSTTAGTLTNVPPTGEAAKIQNIGTVERLHSSNGTIKVGGAGRSNATPNLNDGNVFIGNASNQAVSVDLSTVSLPLAGGTMTGDVSLGDNVKAKFGAGDDLQIYHDGSNSYINDTGTGLLALQGSTAIGLYEYGTFDRMVYATGGADVKLYYDGSPKLATTSTGIDVTGSVAAQDLTLSDTSPIISFTDTDNSLTAQIGSGSTDFNIATTTDHPIDIRPNNTRNMLLYDDTSIFYTNGTERMRITSAGNVGIGNSNPARTLHIEDSSVAAIQLENTSEADSFIDFMNPSRTFRVGYDDSTDLFKVAVTNFNSNALVVNPSGNVGIGTSSPAAKLDVSGTVKATSFQGDGSSLTGIEGVPSGIISMWSGSAAAIPSGWNLCDGTNGTPNLIGKFIKSASTAGGTGGSNTHSHSHTLSAGAHTLSTAQMPSHTHSANRYSGEYHPNNPNRNSHWDTIKEPSLSTATINSTGGSGSHSHSLAGSITSGSNEPAYFELCYIMKS